VNVGYQARLSIFNLLIGLQQALGPGRLVAADRKLLDGDLSLEDGNYDTAVGFAVDVKLGGEIADLAVADDDPERPCRVVGNFEQYLTLLEGDAAVFAGTCPGYAALRVEMGDGAVL